ncbi:acetaldehyde dehydrogenase (acetylating) [candidate division LCP-89 bacterium B3_LCP]|uniref:Acetaldehyde dehydrogenase (Acetylating) n=1 Tax=candidate division LCP-89 bacterium B3_LCP TaxID=2012998 RepID=A0A532UPJ2_UNCL8|nr:MAG: acetaldehyde dehydrogenase (acetylating) [candidate division LCP-89 bacterium B3_LCP]
MDRDLSSVQEVRELLSRAESTLPALKELSQEDVNRITEAMADAGYQAAESLAKMAVEETGFGKYEDKVTKNRFATRNLLQYIAPLKTVGFIEEDSVGKVHKIAEPMGVVAAIIPSTNPTSTALYKAIIAIKARNPIVMSPHPAAVRCTIEVCNVLSGAAQRAGAPKDAILCMSIPEMSGTQELMKNPSTHVILATGGTGLVKAAYSAGKPAFGVGPGNVPAFIERTANVRKAVKDIVASKTFDYGTVCASEQSIVADLPVKDEVVAELKRNNAYFCTSSEIAALEKTMIKSTGGINSGIVGQPAHRIAEMAGFEVTPETSMLVLPMTGVGKDYPLSIEKLSPVICFYEVDGWEQGCEKSLEILNFGGIGHTLVIHSRDEKIIREFALKKPVFRVLVNTPATHGAIGYTTGLEPALTLGCGTWAGSSTSDNVTPLHLINIKRLAYETNPLHEGDTTTESKPTARWRYDDQYHYRPAEEEAAKPETHADAPASPSPLPGSQRQYGTSGITEDQIDAIIKEFGNQKPE